MRIKVNVLFSQKLAQQIDYIAHDSPTHARKFKKELISEIKKILPNPYKHRQSIYFKSEKIRDMVFKGYVIVFRINDEEKSIEIFGFVKYQEKP
ncbi:MAG: type II toxin-antitoxin system RelE/ParE family toxin [Bacteroidota bacterium]